MEAAPPTPAASLTAEVVDLTPPEEARRALKGAPEAAAVGVEDVMEGFARRRLAYTGTPGAQLRFPTGRVSNMLVEQVKDALVLVWGGVFDLVAESSKVC